MMDEKFTAEFIEMQRYVMDKAERKPDGSIDPFMEICRDVNAVNNYPLALTEIEQLREDLDAMAQYANGETARADAAQARADKAEAQVMALQAAAAHNEQMAADEKFKRLQADAACSFVVEACQKAEDRVDAYERALQRISDWAKAYPLKVFPEPDFERVHELLKAGGISLDCVSASNMRHVVEGVGKIADEALKEGEE